jgi:TRAP-type C4-dicarboxylate transport system substrate-binding protein
MKKLFICLSFLLALSLVIGNAVSCRGPEAPKVLRAAGGMPPGDMLSISMADMAERFNERTNGEYTMEFYAGEALSGIQEIFEGVRTGAVELGEWPIEGQSGKNITFSVLGLPFVLNNPRAQLAVLDQVDEVWGPILEEKFNQKALCYHLSSPCELACTKPVRTLEDWQGLLVLSHSPAAGGMIEALGGAPVNIPWTEGYSAAQKGVIEGHIFGTTILVDTKMYDVYKYMTSVFLMGNSGAVTINLDVWNALPKDIQNILLEEAAELNRQMAAFYIDKEEEYIQKAQELGVEVYRVPEAEREIWKEACAPYVEGIIAQMGPEGQKIMDIIDKANQENP